MPLKRQESNNMDQVIQDGLNYVARSDTIKCMIDRGDYIKAIKEVRSALDYSLKDAKDVVDTWRSKAPFRSPTYVKPMTRDVAIMLLRNLSVKDGMATWSQYEKEALEILLAN